MNANGQKLFFLSMGHVSFIYRVSNINKTIESEDC